MVFPSIFSRHHHSIMSTVPTDSNCKSYLHSTVSTFDVLPHGSSMPYISTIMEDIFVHYRSPVYVPAHGLEPSTIETGDQYEGGATFSVPGKNVQIMRA